MAIDTRLRVLAEYRSNPFQTVGVIDSALVQRFRNDLAAHEALAHKIGNFHPPFNRCPELELEGLLIEHAGSDGNSAIGNRTALEKLT